MRRLLPLLPFFLFFLLAAVFYASIGRDTTLAANGMVGKSFPNFSLPLLVGDKDLVVGDKDLVVGDKDLVVGEKDLVVGEKDLERSNLSQALLQEQLQGGEPWLLNVWASWCPQCYVEHAFIDALSAAGAQVIGLNYKDTHEKAQGFLRKMGDPYKLILFDKLGLLGLDLGVSGAPETFLVSPAGEILVRHAGVLDRAVWEQKFAPLWNTASGRVLFSRDEVEGERHENE